MVWLDDWANRIPIAIDHTKIDENLTDFPVLITLSGSEVFDALTVSSTVDAYDVFFLDTRGDESAAANTIKVGQPTSTYQGPKFYTLSGIRCIYFDGSNDLMYATSLSDYDFGTGDFTLEAWTNNTLLSSGYRILSNGVVDGTGAINGSWAFGIGTYTSELKIDFSVRIVGVVYNFRSNDLTGNISVNTWNHVAVTRSAGTLFFYLNGVARGSISCNYDLTLASASNLQLGYRYSSGYVEIFFGSLSKFRLSKGIARYLTDFTPPASYVNDSYTKFLFMNGPNSNVAPSDQDLKSYGETLITRAVTPFNRNASWDFGTASNDIIYMEDSSYLDLGSGDFTIDGWAYIKTYDASSRAILSKRTSVSSSYIWVVIYVSPSGYLSVLATNNGTTWGINFSGSYVALNSWFHFAFVRTGNTFDFYFNGIKTNTGIMSGAIVKDTNQMYIGAADQAFAGDWYGYIYGLRISKGIARYSDNFTPGDPLEYNSSFSNRKKITITDANNNQLYTEIERWDHANKKAWLWTKVPTVASGTNTQLYFYYDKNKTDNIGYVGDTTSTPAQSVWSSGFAAVYHMSQMPILGGQAIKDSTSNNNHALYSTPFNMASYVDSKISKALIYNANDTNLDCGAGSSLDITGPVTLEATVYPTVFDQYDRIIDKSWSSVVDPWSIYSLLLANTEADARYAQFVTTSGNVDIGISTTTRIITKNNWFYITGTTEDGNGRIYVNGILDNTGAVSHPQSFSSRPVFIGKYYHNTSSSFGGIIDEVRISNVSRSSAWVKATYYSNWNDLITFGAIEEPPYFFYEGYVNVLGVPSERRVHLYRRSTGQLVDGTTSSGDGYFKLQSRFPEYHYIIVLPELNEDYPLLFDDKIHPEI
jgi:hypothetical protein